MSLLRHGQYLTGFFRMAKFTSLRELVYDLVFKRHCSPCQHPPNRKSCPTEDGGHVIFQALEELCQKSLQNFHVFDKSIGIRLQVLWQLFLGTVNMVSNMQLSNSYWQAAPRPEFSKELEVEKSSGKPPCPKAPILLETGRAISPGFGKSQLQSIPAVPNRRVSLHCPTAKYPCSA